MINQNGFLCLWKGNLINCVRVIPHSSIQFGTYHHIKNIIQHNNNKDISYQNRIIAGSIAGGCAGTITHPIDLIRIRLQTEKNINTIFNAIQHIYKENGAKNFYRGYFPAIISIVPFIGINFATYDILKDNYQFSKYTFINTLINGSLSAITAQSICYPLDTIRRRSEISGNNYKNFTSSIRNIFNKEGITDFYKGFSVNTIKLIPNNFLRFYIFNFLITNYKLNVT